MAGWFRTKCPCDPCAKAWVEKRLLWLHEQFADSAFSTRPLVLPTAEFFPDPYDGSPETVRKMLDRVCGYMDVPTKDVALRLVSKAGKLGLVNSAGQQLADAAGTYQERGGGFLIRIDTCELGEPMGLVGTMAHELAHAKLLGERRIRRDVYDNELLTDLTVVFFGLGIFLANSPRNWDSAYTNWPGTDLKKPEYMTPPMYAHALAHLAWFRREQRPAWLSHLRWTVRGEVKQAIRYLHESKDSLFRPRHD
jgi:hypothetical protein